MTWIATLIWALVFAQFAGQFHRIEHAAWRKAGVLHALQSSSHSAPNPEHSCISFDAGTLADAIGMASLVASLATGTHLLTSERVCVSWDAPVTPPFLSRAPPVFSS